MVTKGFPVKEMSEPTGFFQKQTTFAHSEHKTKFRVNNSLWNPHLDVIALASSDGEICLKRVHWKTGWKKKLASEAVFYTKWAKGTSEIPKEDVGRFSCMCWSPDGSVLAVLFESGICHYLDVDDGQVLYSVKMQNGPYLSLKWFKLRNADWDGMEWCFKNDGCVGHVRSDHLKSKESDSVRNHYQLSYGVEKFCHVKVRQSLKDTILVASGQHGEFVGFDVYMCGVLLIKSIEIDGGFMHESSDRYSVEIRDVCLLPSSNLQLALSTMSFGTAEFDETCGFVVPDPSGSPAAGSTVYVVEYDIGLKNTKIIKSLAKIAMRMVHIVHLLTNFRETFLKAVAEWEMHSEVFHTNIFKKLYEKYQAEAEGKVADFCMDFVCYILIGQAPDSFAHAIFKDIRPKQWKPAKEFVVKHIPQLMNTLNRHLVVLIDALYSQMTNFVSELEEYENFDEKTGRPNLSLKKNKEPPSEPVVQCRKLKVLLNFLSRRVTQVIEVAGDNWTELKYMLQLLCLHPDSEGLEVEIDNDYEGIIREQDFELLIKFICNALFFPSKLDKETNWYGFLTSWKTRLQSEKKEDQEQLACNPMWLKHRSFDKIGPILGTCADLPTPEGAEEDEMLTLPERFGIVGTHEESKFAEPLDYKKLLTVNDVFHYIFDTFETIYSSGTINLRNQAHTKGPQLPLESICIDYCHPEAISKMVLIDWESLKVIHTFMNKEASESTLERLELLEEQYQTNFKSIIAMHRNEATTLQCYAIVSEIPMLPEYSTTCVVSPRKAIRLGAWSSSHTCDSYSSTVLNMFMNSRYHVLDFEIYGAGSLHFLAQACHVEETGEEIEIDKDSCTSVFIVKCDVLGQIGYIDEVSVAYTTDISLQISPQRAVGVTFERNFEHVKWFDLEMNSLNQVMDESMVEASQLHHTTINFSPLKVKRELRDNESQESLAQTPTSSRAILRQIKTEPVEDDEDEEEPPQPVDLDDAIYVELDSSPSISPQHSSPPYGTSPQGWAPLGDSFPGATPPNVRFEGADSSAASSAESDNESNPSPSSSPANEHDDEEFEDDEEHEHEHDQEQQNQMELDNTEDPEPSFYSLRNDSEEREADANSHDE